MPKNVYYRYNPETDNFERVYPSLRMRLKTFGKIFGLALILAVLIFTVIFYCFDSPTEENLRAENSQLRMQFNILNKRLDNSLKVLSRIQERDNNFYRVMLQMDPMTPNQRLSGLDNDSRYKELQRLNDAGLVTRLTQSMDLLERQLFAQVQSFDQIRETVGMEKDKLARIPSVLPLTKDSYTISSGYGYRRDPVYGSTILHEGVDLAAPIGTNVYATADGKITQAQRAAGYGNCIDIDHGYNYLSRYGNLSEILVKEGDEIKRGQLIGKVGSTGKSTGPHLHYEVRFKDEAQNPVNYFFMDLNPEEYSAMLQVADNAGLVMD